MQLSFRERAMLKAASASAAPKLAYGEIVVAISPTRGVQLARVTLSNAYVSGRVLVRIGGPQNVLEEVPDFLTDAKPFLALDVTTQLIRELQQKLKKAVEERDEALRQVESLRDRRAESRTN